MKIFIVSKYGKSDIIHSHFFGIIPLCINNIVDIDIFKARAHTMNDLVKAFSFITMSNLIANKKVDLVVLALSELIKEGKYANLIIAGDGRRRSDIENHRA